MPKKELTELAKDIIKETDILYETDPERAIALVLVIHTFVEEALKELAEAKRMIHEAQEIVYAQTQGHAKSH